MSVNKEKPYYNSSDSNFSHIFAPTIFPTKINNPCPNFPLSTLTFHLPPAALPYNPALALWLSVDPLSDKYPGVSPYTYCGNNPVRLVDEDGREVDDPRLNRIVNMGFKSKTFRTLFHKAGLTTENMSHIIIFGLQSTTVPQTGEITLLETNSDMENVIALSHEMTNRIHSTKLGKSQNDVMCGKISPEQFADNAILIESKGIANQIIVASELDYTFPENYEYMNALKEQYSEGRLNRRKLIKTIRESTDFKDEFGNDAKQKYNDYGKQIRDAQIRRENQSRKTSL